METLPKFGISRAAMLKRVARSCYLSMIFSDLPSPAEASNKERMD